MLIEYLTRTPVSQERLFRELQQIGGHTSHAARIRCLRSRLPNHHVQFSYVADPRAAWDRITASLGRGNPVLLSTRLTRSGHVVLVVGATERAGKKYLVVHDPAGRFDFRRRGFVEKQSGAFQQYPFWLMYVRNRQVLPAPSGARAVLRWEGYCVAEDAWFEIKTKKDAELNVDAKVVKDLKDWEFVEIAKTAEPK